MARSHTLEVPGLGTVTLGVAAGAGTVRVPVTLLGITRTAALTPREAYELGTSLHLAAQQAGTDMQGALGGNPLGGVLS